MHSRFDHLDRAVIATADAVLLSIILALGTLVPGADVGWLLAGYIVGCVVRAIRNGWTYYKTGS